MKRFVALYLCLSAIALQSGVAFAKGKVSKVITPENIEWGYLNPLRGALSPGAANLWGDRAQNTATGMLVRFKKGFQSPPHIHNVSYRGVVLDALLHNASPDADKMWMPQGSFWTQPAGENHITAADAETNLIYLEIDSGPYLVKPSKEAFDSGERALNLHTNNIVWLGEKDLKNINVEGAESSYLWGSPSGLGGSMLKIPANFKGAILTEASEFRAVLVSGKVNYSSSEQRTIELTAGSYLESIGAFKHEIANVGNQDAIFYIRTNQKYRAELIGRKHSQGSS